MYQVSSDNQTRRALQIDMFDVSFRSLSSQVRGHHLLDQGPGVIPFSDCFISLNFIMKNTKKRKLNEISGEPLPERQPVTKQARQACLD